MRTVQVLLNRILTGMELHPDVVLPSRVHVAAKERSSAAEIQVLGMDVRTAKTREQSRGNVNSTSIQTVCTSPSGCDWPYLIDGTSNPSSGMIPMSGGLGQLSSSTAGLTGSMASSSFPSSIHYPRTQAISNFSSIPYSGTPGRQQYYASYSAGLGDATFDSYAIQSPHYLLPAQDSTSSTVAYGGAESSRQWLPAGSSGRPSQGGLVFDHDDRSRYGSSCNFPYPNSSGSTSSTVSDTGSLFPAMGSLALSLPAPFINSDRVLPNPTSSTAQNASGNSVNASLGALGETLPFLPSQGASTRYTVPWGPERVTTGGSRNSSSTTLSATTLTGAISSKPSSSPTDCQDSAFGYIPITQSPSLTTVSATDYNSAVAGASTASFDGQIGPPNSTYESTLPTEPILRSHDSSSNLYTYSVGSSAKRGSIAESTTSDGTLLSGQPYTRLRQPQPQHASSFDGLRRASLETISRNTHRTSISSVANSRR
ncbi:hypothetical protein MMC24_004977 [Lignoscripta atroalba]|nr:hypothetical protein [Lignoscripta atroalba]